MKRDKTQLTFRAASLLLIVMLSAAVSLTAQDRGKSGDKKKYHGHSLLLLGSELFDARTILKLKDEIGLDGRQEKAVKNAMLTAQEALIRKGAEIKILELRFAAYVGSDKPDRGKVAKYIGEIGKKKADIIIDHIHYLLDLKEILSARQWQQLKEKRSKRKSSRSRRPGYNASSLGFH